MRLLLAAAVLLFSSVATAAKAPAQAIAETLAGIHRARVPQAIKARALRALDRTLRLEAHGPVATYPAQSWTTTTSSLGPRVAAVSTLGGRLRSRSVAFTGGGAPRNEGKPFSAWVHGISWDAWKHDAKGFVVRVSHQVGPIAGGRFIDAVTLRRERIGGYGRPTRVFHLLDARGRRIASLDESWALEQISAFRRAP